MSTVASNSFRAGTGRTGVDSGAGNRGRSPENKAAAGNGRRARPGAESEADIHRALVALLEVAAVPGLVWTHIPAGEARGPGVGGKLKGMGVKPGWPDLLLLHAGRAYGLELKRIGGKVSPAQRDVHARLQRAGVTVAVAYGLDAAANCLSAWGLIRVARKGTVA